MLTDALVNAWRRTPALFYALFILIGAALPLTRRIELLLPILLLWVLLRKAALRQLLLATALLLGSAFLTHHRTQWPTEALGQRGMGQFQIESVHEKHSALGDRWNYRGTLQAFWTRHEGVWKPLALRNVPCFFSLGPDDPKPAADGTYLIHGRLEEASYPLLTLKTVTECHRLGGWSLAQWRCATKQRVCQWIRGQITNPSAAAFLSGMATGEMDDPMLLSDLGRFGLQHLLAVSGLHFALLASLLAFGLRSCLSERMMAPILLLLLTCYALFVGDSPSVLRAWVSSCALWMALLVHRPSSGANNLGFALGALILYKPLWVLHLGFQLSFLATAAILLLSHPIDRLLQRLVRPRPLTESSQMALLDQHGYITLHIARRAAAITLAVHLAVAPLLAYTTHQFGWLSLLYNLFFPPLVAPALWLLVLAGLFAWPLPWLSQALCWLNSHYTAAILRFVEGIPPRLNPTWQVDTSLWLCLAWLTLLFGWSLLSRRTHERQPHWLI